MMGGAASLQMDLQLPYLALRSDMDDYVRMMLLGACYINFAPAQTLLPNARKFSPTLPDTPIMRIGFAIS
jgi:hypothetical protein